MIFNINADYKIQTSLVSKAAHGKTSSFSATHIVDSPRERNGLEKVVDNKVEAEVKGDEDDNDKGENDTSRKSQLRNLFLRPNSIRNSLQATLRL